MARWKPDAMARLQAAAFELYAERGFEQTTAAEIAAHAGLSERTFFRHFADKREVLFAGSEHLEQIFVRGVAEADPELSALAAVGAGLALVGPLFDGMHTQAGQRATIIASHPGLQERELIKLAALSAAVAGALRERGVTEPAASLAADAAVSVFHVGFARWLADGGDLGPHFAHALAELTALR